MSSNPDRQATLAALKASLDAAIASRDLARATYDEAAQRTGPLGKARVTLEAELREKTKAALAAFDAQANALKQAKFQTTLALQDAEKRMFELADQWERVKHEYVETASESSGQPAVETPVDPPPQTETAPESPAVEPSIEDGPGAAFGAGAEPVAETAETVETPRAKKRRH